LGRPPQAEAEVENQQAETEGKQQANAREVAAEVESEAEAEKWQVSGALEMALETPMTTWSHCQKQPRTDKSFFFVGDGFPVDSHWAIVTTDSEHFAENILDMWRKVTTGDDQKVTTCDDQKLRMPRKKDGKSGGSRPVFTVVTLQQVTISITSDDAGCRTS
jgi:hypothetical protein